MIMFDRQEEWRVVHLSHEVMFSGLSGALSDMNDVIAAVF